MMFCRAAGAGLMVHSAQEVDMSAYEKPKTPRPKPSRSSGSYGSGVGQPAQGSSDSYGTGQTPPPGYGTDAPAPAYGTAAPEPSSGYGSIPPDPPPPSYRSSRDDEPPPPGGASLPPGFPPYPPQFTPPYAFLTRDIDGFSGRSIDSSPGSSGAASGSNLGATVSQALQRVLSWKIRDDDSKGFVSALNQSFSLTLFEGHVRAKWTPRSVTVESDLSGCVTGAQASIYMMAKTLLDQALPLLDGLGALKPDVDYEYVEVLRQTAATQLRTLVGELNMLGGPRLLLVNQNFRALAGIPVDANGVLQLQKGQIEFWKDPDQIAGSLGGLRDQLGLGASRASYVNSVAAEKLVTDFGIVVQYINAIFDGWRNSLKYFNAMQSPYLGTQLVWISRLLGVVNEAIEEVRFVLDSVFIGRAERETLLMTGLVADGKPLPPITLAGLLLMIQSLVTQELPDIIQNGGKFAIGEDVSEMVGQLKNYMAATIGFAEAQDLSALSTDRVLIALYKLQRQLQELENTAKTVGIPKLPLPPIEGNA
jgi:hypothetical protein